MLTGKKDFYAFACMLVITGLIAPASAVDNPPYDQNFTYHIARKGDRIGTHSVSYNRAEHDRLDVRIDVRIRVKFAFITAFRMDHEGHEVWSNDQLLRMSTRTNRNKEEEAVDVRAADGHYVVSTAERIQTAPMDLVPSSFTKTDFWIADGSKEFMLLDTLSGRMRQSRLEAGDIQTLTLDGQAYDVRYYRVLNLEDNEMSHEFWIDPEGYLIKAHLLTRDGESLHYSLASAADV